MESRKERQKTPRRPKKIIIVDDNAAFAELLGDLLEFHGFEIRHACDSRMMWKMITRYLPDAFVLDLNLGEENGFFVLQALKKALPSIPVVMATSAGYKDQLMEQALMLEADAFVSKNGDLRELILALHRSIRKNTPIPVAQPITPRAQPVHPPTTRIQRPSA